MKRARLDGYPLQLKFCDQSIACESPIVQFETNSTEQNFELSTPDGRTCICGQIDFPNFDAGNSNHPVVLIVNGGWFMERDGFMGNSGTERDLIYRDLAQGILAAGFAVVRYDNRGVRCNEMTMPAAPVGASEEAVTTHYFNACIDTEVRKTVSVKTQMDDIRTVWDFTVNHPRVATNRVIIWAHSEGGLNVGRLISSQQIFPLGVIVVGTTAESPAELVHATMVDRFAEHLMGWDTDRDGRVTRADVDRSSQVDHYFFAAGITMEMLIPPSDGWSLRTARDHFETLYIATKSAALANADDAPYPNPAQGCFTVAASNQWWRQWFEDTKPIIDHFADYLGHLSFHFGEIDSQFSGPDAMAFAESRIQSGVFAKTPRLVFHQGRGHALRTNEPAAGPMDDEAKASLIEEIREIFSST